MTKKILYGMMAAIMLFATSCEKEPELGGNAGQKSVVSFNIGTPEIATRAYSDGATATVLQYAVYDAAGTELTDLTVTDGEIHGSTTVNLQLTTGNTYSVIFWAAAPNAPYSVDFANKTMTVDYTNAVSNDEKRDAFYKYHTFTVTGAQTETIELKRPFAQLNIGTNDYEASASAGYEPAYSYVKVPVSSELNLVDGTVNEAAPVEFKLAAIPQGETFPVANYDYLSMNYLLVPADDTVVDLTFGYSENDTTIEKSRIVGSVPVQRNYRTNIYGQLLTSNVKVNVEIEPDYEEPSHELDALHKAALNGGEITLTEDLVLTTPLEVMSEMTINLNGKTIRGNHHKSVGAIIKNNGTLTIIGGTISSLGENGGSAVQNNGTMSIKDATLNGAPNANSSWPSYAVNNTGSLSMENTTITSYHGAVASYESGAVVTLNDCTIDMAGIPGFTSHGIYTYKNGKVIINGGTYANKATDQNATGASVINGAVEVNAGTFSGRIENYFGTPVLKGGVYSVSPKASYIAEGYKAVEKSGKYFVVANEVDAIVETQEELVDVLANENTHTIYLGAGTFVADIYNGTPARESLTIIGSEGTKFGHTATTGGQLRLDLFESFTIRNCEIIQRSGVKTWGHIVFGSGNKANGVYTIENCTFNGVGTQGIYINENTTGATYNILNCTFNGNFGNEGAITIQTNKDVNHTVNVMGCTFNNTPDTSHRIFLAKSTAGWFYDFTLNTDLKAYSAYDLAMFVALGKTNIDLADGEYDVYGCAGKTLTLNGSANAILKLYNDGEDGCDYAFGGNGTGVGNITFNGLTINTESNTGNYKGYAYMKGTFNNCNFVGAYSLNNANDFIFNGCTFDFKNGYFWTWGANSVTFDGCTFNGNSKNILAHGYTSTEITINDCTFAATDKGYTSAGDNTACIEIDPAGTNVYTINFTGTNTKTDKYAGWTRIKDGSTGHTITGI